MLLTIFVLLSGVNAAPVFAQAKSSEFIVLKMIIKKEIFEQQTKIPIEKSFDDSKLTGGGFTTVDCVGCPLTSEYEIYGFAEKVNQSKTRVSLTAEFKNQKACDFKDKIFVVSRNKSTKLKLRCGVEIIAYRERETTNN